VDGRPGKIDEHGTQGRGSLTVGMSTIQDIDREAARRVARVLGEDADAEAPGSDEGTGEAALSPSSQHAATMDEARTTATHTSRVAGRAWPYVPRILALAAVVAAISGLLQIAGNSKHGRNRTGSLGQSGQVNPDDPQGVPAMKNTIQRQMMNAAVTAAIGATTNAQQAVQWRVEDGGNGRWYGIVDLGSSFATISQATHLLARRGCEPCVFEDESEWLWYVQSSASLPNGGEAQFGLHRLPGQEWTTYRGAPIPYAGWGHPGLPNNGSWQEVGAYAHARGCGGSTAPCWEDYLLTEMGQRIWIVEWSADCNNDGIVDYGQILSGQLADADTNGVPDTCECPCDVFRDNAVNGIDLGVLLGQWGEVTQYTVTDFNRDGAVDGSDLGQLLAAWGPCPS
jgi:hypothetical protein